MGLLGQTYASPQFMLDWAVDSGSLLEFVVKVLDDNTEKKLWDIFLHSNTDLSFDEFKRSVKEKREAQTATPAQIGSTINRSRSILSNFKPKEGEPYH